MKSTRMGALLLLLVIGASVGFYFLSKTNFFSNNNNSASNNPTPSDTPPSEPNREIALETENCAELLKEYSNRNDYQQVSSSVEEQIKLLSTWGDQNQKDGRYQAASCLHQESLKLARAKAQKLSVLSTRALSGIGNAQLKMGKFSESLNSFKQALVSAQQIERQQTKNLSEQAIALGGIGDSYLALGNYEEARKYNQQRLGVAYQTQLSAESPQENREGGLTSTEATELIGDTLASLGHVSYALGNTTGQAEHYDQAITYFKMYKDKTSYRQKDALAEIGIAKSAAAKSKDNQEANKAFEEARKKIDDMLSCDDMSSCSKALDNWREVWKQYYSLYINFALERKLYDLAVEAADLYIKVAKGEGRVGNASNASPKEEYDLQALSEAHNLRGLALFGKSISPANRPQNMQENLLQESQKTFEEAVKVRRELLKQPLSDTLKVFFFDTQRNAYLNLQQVLIHQAKQEKDEQKKQEKKEEALYYSELGRAQVIGELLRNQSDGSRDQSTDNIAIEQNKLIEQIKILAKEQNTTFVEYSLIEHPIDGNANNGSEAKLLIWVVQPSGNIEFIEQPIGAKLQKWQKAKSDLGDDRTGEQTVTWIQTVRQLIGIETDDGRTGKTVVVTVDNSDDNQPPQKRSNNSAIATAPTEQNEQEQKAREAKQAETLKELHEILIQPIAEYLPKNENDRVVFIPDGSMFLIPFAALQDKSGAYLIDKHTILTAPSIQVFRETSNRLPKSQLAGNMLGELFQNLNIFSNRNTANALVVGNPTMPRLECVGETKLSPLGGAEQEAEAIAKELGTKPLIGMAATEKAVTGELRDAPIIHLATHGLLDNCAGWSVPGGIALAPSGDDEPENGWLTASEISNISGGLKADLVVLSACDTGQGRLTGDGVIGLSRAFMLAGASSVIVTLWSIPDAPTADLMTVFYQKLNSMGGKRDKAIALRQAMLDIKQQHPNPRDWAAFTLIGVAN